MTVLQSAVIPAKAGIHFDRVLLTQEEVDSRFRGNDDLHGFAVLKTSGQPTLPEKTDKKDDRMTVERVGGFAGFGGPGSHLKSAGEVVLSSLSVADRKAIDVLFSGAGRAAAAKPDAFVYRITRRVSGVVKTIEVSEERVPDAVRKCVKSALE